MMDERSYAVVRVDEAVFLVLPELGRCAAGRPPPSEGGRLLLPLEPTGVVRVLAGGPHEDFRWAPVAPEDLTSVVAHRPCGAGVAAAAAARLFGLVAGAGDVTGKALTDGRIRRYSPAEGDWWNGSWFCETSDPGFAIPDPGAMDAGGTATRVLLRPDGRHVRVRLRADAAAWRVIEVQVERRVRLVMHGELVLR